jgi:hypothetical protein
MDVALALRSLKKRKSMDSRFRGNDENGGSVINWTVLHSTPCRFILPVTKVILMSKLAKGTFKVKLQPLAFEDGEADTRLGRMSINKSIEGDLVATTCGQMLSARTAAEGSAGYVAIERVDGVLAGRKGTFVLLHAGIMDRGSPNLSVRVVPDSATGELVGLAGRFDIKIEAGVHRYEFEYSLPQ